eukprot:CAMPEP_0169431020 /NCGR_PEP_ID=MMETSP1042-20121227/2713_1 /TAXON_ID=464988 /ORGANISM="Hemiselmis andersenii, Strain CCMP1180" /LENGTH=64 /DNA_ID=CAMNT_0009541381 /DNA_START=42 /DNA_END=232 /DNA_ORIENTATION=-
MEEVDFDDEEEMQMPGQADVGNTSLNSEEGSRALAAALGTLKQSQEEAAADDGHEDDRSPEDES